MASTIPFAAAGTELSLDELSTMLFLQPQQIQAVLDPACAARSLSEVEQPQRSDVDARIGELVRACALTGCPPCVRRLGA